MSWNNHHQICSKSENDNIKVVSKDILKTLIRYAQSQRTEHLNDLSVSYNRNKVKSMSCFPIDAIVAENQPGGIIIQLGILACFR